MALDEKQRCFCRLVAVEGLKPGPAYTQAFGVKPRSGSTLAGRLIKRVDIQDEIQRLYNRVDAQQDARDVCGVWSKAERFARLQEWAMQAAADGHVGDAVRCVDLMNKMDGAYAPEQVEVKAAVAVATVDFSEVMGRLGAH